MTIVCLSCLLYPTSIYLIHSALCFIFFVSFGTHCLCPTKKKSKRVWCFFFFHMIKKNFCWTVTIFIFYVFVKVRWNIKSYIPLNFWQISSHFLHFIYQIWWNEQHVVSMSTPKFWFVFAYCLNFLPVLSCMWLSCCPFFRQQATWDWIKALLYHQATPFPRLIHILEKNKPGLSSKLFESTAPFAGRCQVVWHPHFVSSAQTAIFHFFF